MWTSFWGQSHWETEGLDAHTLHWSWCTSEETPQMDLRELIRFIGSMLPPFDEETPGEDARTTFISTVDNNTVSLAPLSRPRNGQKK